MSGTAAIPICEDEEQEEQTNIQLPYSRTVTIPICGDGEQEKQWSCQRRTNLWARQPICRKKKQYKDIELQLTLRDKEVERSSRFLQPFQPSPRQGLYDGVQLCYPHSPRSRAHKVTEPFSFSSLIVFVPVIDHSHSRFWSFTFCFVCFRSLFLKSPFQFFNGNGQNDVN